MIVNTGKKVFFLAFPPLLGLTTVTGFLDTRPEVLNWLTLFPDMVLIVSVENTSKLSALMREQFPNFFFFISEIDPLKTDGWLPQVVWDFINAPKSSGRWDAPPPKFPSRYRS